MNSTPLSFLHTGPLQGSHTAENLSTSSSVTVCVCVFCNTLCCASLLSLSVLNVTAHVCTSQQPIVGALVIHIRTHLLLRPSKGFTSGDEISWGHIKALCAWMHRERAPEEWCHAFFFLPPLVLSGRIWGSPGHVFLNSGGV